MISSRTEMAIPREKGMEGEIASLLLPQGAEDLHLRVGDAEHLVTGTFSGRTPEAELAGSTLSLRFPRVSVGLTASSGFTQMSSGRLKRGAVSNVGMANLTGLALRGIRIAGGVSRLRLNLPRPYRRVPIEVEGGADRIEVWRREDARTVLEIHGGASSLIFGDQHFRSLSGQTRLESHKGKDSAGEYLIKFKRGTSRASVLPSDERRAAR